MLVVKVELWPDGDGRKRETLANVRITNDGTGDGRVGNYDVTHLTAERHIIAGSIKGHVREQGYWPLVARVMAAVAKIACQKED